MSLLTKFCYPDDPKARNGRFYNLSPMPRWLWVTIIAIATVLYILQLAVFSKGSILMDGYSYYNAWETIKGGHTDYLRTPVYTIVVGALYEIFGKEGSLILVPAVNWVFYIVSIRLLWDINQQLEGEKTALNATCMLTLMLIPGFWLLVNFSMAEVMALMWLTMLLWLTPKLLRVWSQRLLYLCGGLIAVTVLTKPLMIFLVVLMPALWIIAGWKRNGILLSVTKAMILPVTLLAGYLYCMVHTYEMPYFTIANSYNTYICLRNDSLLKPEDIKDEELRENFRQWYELRPGGVTETSEYWRELHYGYCWQDLGRMCNDAISSHPGEAAEAVLRRFGTSLTASQFYNLKEDLGSAPARIAIYRDWNGLTHNHDDGFIYPLHNILQPPIFIGLLLTLTYIILWCRRWRRRHRFPAFAALIAAVYVSAYIVTVTGSPDIWGRILFPVNPLLAVMGVSLTAAVVRGCRKRYVNIYYNKSRLLRGARAD